MQRRHFLFALIAALLPVVGARADDDGNESEHRRGRGRRRGRDDDHRDAADALKTGETKPLRDILDALAKSHPGEIVGVEFERLGNDWVYEIKLISPDSLYMEIYVDARSGDILKIEGKQAGGK